MNSECLFFNVWNVAMHFIMLSSFCNYPDSWLVFHHLNVILSFLPKSSLHKNIILVNKGGPRAGGVGGGGWRGSWPPPKNLNNNGFWIYLLSFSRWTILVTTIFSLRIRKLFPERSETPRNKTWYLLLHFSFDHYFTEKTQIFMGKFEKVMVTSCWNCQIDS